jgi:hypothetical protein
MNARVQRTACELEERAGTAFSGVCASRRFSRALRRDEHWLAHRGLEVHIRNGILFGAALIFLGPAAGGDEASTRSAPAWPDSFLSRLEALALVETLNADLLSHDSATLTLERWCDSHHLASPARIVAQRDSGLDKPASPDQRLELGVSPTEAVRYRRVRLMCGPWVLSEADNWYVPSRLTPEMNQLLDTTDQPFGKVVKPLNFQRRTLSARLLWLPLPQGWEMTAASGEAGGVLSVPPAILEHRAILSVPNGTPFSEVVETYSRNVLAFPIPPR